MGTNGGRPVLEDGLLSPGLVGKLAAGVWMVSSLLVMGTQLIEPGGASRSVILGAGAVTLGSGLVLWKVPWERFSRQAILWLVPGAFATIGIDYLLAGRNGFLYAITYVMVFALLGMCEPRGTALRFGPLLMVAYVVPLIVGAGHEGSLGLASGLYVIPVCLIVGEAVAWGMSLLARSEATLARAEERNTVLFEEAPVGMAVAGLDGTLLRVNRSYAAILGHEPDDLVGRTLRDLTYPDDWDENGHLFDQLLRGEIDRYSLEKRYLHADGHGVWVSVSATCVRDDGGVSSFVIGQIEDVTERRTLREELAHAAVHDQLTGLPNRAMFMEHLERALLRAERDRRHVALFFLDLDRFKHVNDGLGHDAGDRLLQRVAARLQSAVRPGDLLARFGGDEFTLVCEVRTEDEAVTIAERLKESLVQPVGDADHEQFVSVSIGVAVSTGEATHPGLLLRCADIAMYQAKDAGPAQIAVYSGDDELATVRNLRTSNELHRAIERSELVLHYQPFVDLRDHSLVGAEALVRWQHPTRGLLPPGEFVDLAEENGLIVPLGTWVLREACRQGAAWAAARPGGRTEASNAYLSVNVSPRQLAEPGFIDEVATILGETGMAPEQLWLEITEGAILRDPDTAVATLRALRSLGVHLAIDDFGTGYSSLGYLKQLPVEVLKIDRGFVANLEGDADDKAIVQAVIALGRSLGIGVIAEGIERPAQAAELLSMGCHLAQGFHYGRPTPAAAIGRCLPDRVADWIQPGQLTVA